MRIVFFGTPEFAKTTLALLCDNNENVVAVVTAPDKPAGRGRKLTASAVKEYALSKNIPVLQPVNLKEDSFLSRLKAYQADLQIVVAFRMLPEQVWNMPPLGTFNLHASLLPDYRGAAPINHAIINGESETGVTTFFLEHTIDTGKIILQERTKIGMSETAGELHDRLMNMGAALVLKSVQLIKSGNFQLTDQSSLQYNSIKVAPKIFKEHCRINWNRPVRNVYNLIRGLSPYPGAYSELKSNLTETVLVKFYKTSYDEIKHGLEPGTIETDGKSLIRIYSSDGFITVEELQLAGKKAMNASEFLRGYSFSASHKFV